MQERYIVIPLKPREVAIPQAIEVLTKVGMRQINRDKQAMEGCGCHQCKQQYARTQLWWDGPQWKTERGQGTLFTRWEQQRKIDEAG